MTDRPQRGCVDEASDTGDPDASADLGLEPKNGGPPPKKLLLPGTAHNIEKGVPNTGNVNESPGNRNCLCRSNVPKNTRNISVARFMFLFWPAARCLSVQNKLPTIL